jgi:hypothetical protein
VVAIGPRFAEAVEGFLNSNKIGVVGAIEPGRYRVRSISPEMAVRLPKAFGGSPVVWLKLQMNYDLAQGREACRQDQGAARPAAGLINSDFGIGKHLTRPGKSAYSRN